MLLLSEMTQNFNICAERHAHKTGSRCGVRKNGWFL